MRIQPERVPRHAAHALPQPFDAGVRLADRRVHDPAAERRSLVAGLRSTPASIAPKYFYDAKGCALFGHICQLPEYYPTRTEPPSSSAIARTSSLRSAPASSSSTSAPGDCAKAAAWLPWLRPQRYVAVDIAGDALARSLPRIAAAHPAIDMLGVLTDFTRGLDLGRDVAEGPTTFFYPGSSIGNFTPQEALEFLQTHPAALRRRPAQRPSDRRRHQEGSGAPRAAYDDAAGVTAAFNRNVLNHVNRDPRHVLRSPVAFAHVAFYDEAAGRIEMHLESRARADGAHRRRRAHVRRRRAHPHRELVQVRAAGVRRDARSARDSRRSAAGRMTPATSPSTTRADAKGPTPP